MGMVQPTPEQIAALQQTNQIGGMGDPAMQPNMAAGASAPVDAQQVEQAILGLIMTYAQRVQGADELNPDVLANTINTLASAYKSIGDAQQAGPNPQVQQQIDVAKAQHEMQLKQNESDTKQAQIQHDMMLKEQAHNAEQQRLDEAHKAQLLMQAHNQNHQQTMDQQNQLSQQALNQQKISNQHEIAQKQATQKPKPKA